MAALVGFMERKLPIEIIRLLKMKKLHPEFSVPDEINELDIFKLDPSELPGRSKSNSYEQAWPFFSEPYKHVKGKQAHPTNGRGNWEKKGKDVEVRDKSTGKRIGGKKIYVYYKRGGAPKQKIKTDWVMHEYYVDDDDPCYKKDFVFRYVEKNPMGKPNTSTPDDDQPSHSLASDAETYEEETSTEVESQDPLTQCLGNEFLEVESELQSNHSLLPDIGNYFATNTSAMEVELGILSNQNFFHDQRNPIAPITSSMVQSQLLPNHNSGFDPRITFADNTSSMDVESRLLSDHNLVSDDQRNHLAPITSSMVQPQLLSNYNLEFDPRNHFVPNTSLMDVESRLLSNHNLVSDDQRNHFAPIVTSSMVQPQLLSNQNLEFDPRNHFVPSTSLMLLPHQNLDSGMVGPQLLSNQNTGFEPINRSASITSSMVESQLLSDQNLVSDYSRNHFAPNTSSMVAHDQLLSNHNFFSDTRNQFAPNTFLMVHPQQVEELFAQFTALFARYFLNHSSDSASQWPNNLEHGFYSSPYTNDAFGNNCTLSGSQLEDAWTAERNFQDIYPCEATGQTLPAYTDTHNTKAFMDE